MKGSYYRQLCALLLALASIHGSTAKLNMNDVCALVNDGLMIAAYDACDTYYVCYSGFAIQQSCMSGNYFSKEYQACMPQDQVQCTAVNATPCAGANSFGTWAPVSGSCTDFYYCGLNGPERASCPFGELFDPNQQSCVYADQYSCQESTDDAGSSDSMNDSGDVSIPITLPLNLCNFMPNGMYFGSPASCNGWNICYDNGMISGVCSDGLLYNTLNGECDYPSGVSCSQVTNDPYLSPNSCNTTNAMMAGTSCDTYFICIDNVYQIAQCPAGNFFDTVSQTCVNRLDARNNCDRCVGSTSSFVNMYSATNCTGYLFCVNGVESSTGYCPSGTYFNESNGVCVQTTIDPLLGCCNPAFYNSTVTDSTTDAGNSTVTEIDSTTPSFESTTTSIDITTDNTTTDNTTLEPTTVS